MDEKETTRAKGEEARKAERGGGGAWGQTGRMEKSARGKTGSKKTGRELFLKFYTLYI